MPILTANALIAQATRSSVKTVVVTVDDLPIAGGGLHTDPEERSRCFRGRSLAFELS